MEDKKAGKLCNADGTLGVRLVYIDPPFATQQEFRGTQDQKAYRDKVLGAEFVEFLRQRFIILHELLAADGSLFLHADYRKVHYLKVILDEIFDEPNFRNEIILPGRASKNLQQQFEQITRLNVRHDTLLWYSANAQARFSKLWVEKHKAGNPEGHWHHFWSTADRPSMRYELFGTTPRTGQWTWEEGRAKRAVASYERYEREGGGRTIAEYWRDTGTALEFIRRSPDDGKPQYWRAPAELRLADTVWTGVPIYNNTTGYPTEKNEALLSQVIELASAEGDLVLDAFVGSGTTVAVAEKLGRRWIGIDTGKLSLYTTQKRLLNATSGIGGGGAKLTLRPFTLYNAGLYDFSTLRQLPWEHWRFFALQLFGCKDEPHTIGGIKLDGKRKGASVLVWNHHEHAKKRIDEETIESLHAALGSKIGREFYIIAPKGVFDFQHDYEEIDGVRYYALRIPYSFISELHRRAFTALRQPNDESNVNDFVEAVGFDFNQPPRVQWSAGAGLHGGRLIPDAFLHVTGFESHARLRGEDAYGGLDTLSMLMVDFDYNGNVFDLDSVIYGHQLKAGEWRAWFPLESLGEKVMAIFVDTHGNEARIVIPREQFDTEPVALAASEASA